MLNGISSGASNTIQSLTASSAFKVNQENFDKSKQQEKVEEEAPSGVNLKDNNGLLSNINVNDIRKYAKIEGQNLTDEDIKYGLTFGRSVIADYNV